MKSILKFISFKIKFKSRCFTKAWITCRHKVHFVSFSLQYTLNSIKTFKLQTHYKTFTVVTDFGIKGLYDNQLLHRQPCLWEQLMLCSYLLRDTTNPILYKCYLCYLFPPCPDVFVYWFHFLFRPTLYLFCFWQHVFLFGSVSTTGYLIASWLKKKSLIDCDWGRVWAVPQISVPNSLAKCLQFMLREQILWIVNAIRRKKIL